MHFPRDHQPFRRYNIKESTEESHERDARFTRFQPTSDAQQIMPKLTRDIGGESVNFPATEMTRSVFQS
jgi:hypothetical protein